MGASSSSAIPDGSSEDREPQQPDNNNNNNNQGRSVWSPPPKGRYKVNTDGGCRPVDDINDDSDDGVRRGPSGYGGLLRDHQGNWVRGFIGFIGVSDCLTSEFYGILKGLELLDKLKLTGSILETDCQAACQWITGEGDQRGKSQIVRECWPMIISCRQLAVKNNITIELILGGNANRCADKLADMAIEREENYLEFKDVIPYELRDLVEKETIRSSDGGSIGTVTAIASAAVGVATVAWGISQILSEYQERNHHKTTPSFLNPPDTIPNGVIKKRSVWSPPPLYRFKINTDGACRPVLGGRQIASDDRIQRGPSGYGGILRDHYGNWVQGFLGFIGESDCLTSELHGILKGLELLDDLKLTGSILETDCQSAYEWITRHGDHYSKSGIVRACWPMIISCRQLAVKNNITIELILGGDANRCADKLADMAIDREVIDHVEIKEIPNELRNLVEKDANNYSY